MRRYRRNADDRTRALERRAHAGDSEAQRLLNIERIRGGDLAHVVHVLAAADPESLKLVPEVLKQAAVLSIARAGGHIVAWEATYQEEYDMPTAAVLSTNLSFQGAMNSCIESAAGRVEGGDEDEGVMENLDRLLGRPDAFEEAMNMVHDITGIRFRVRKAWIYP